MRFGYIVAGMLLAGLVGCSAQGRRADAGRFDPGEIRAAERAVIAALESPDPLAWVDLYTDDAVLLEGSHPVQGRAALLEMARTMKPLSSVVISPLRTEGHGNFAYVYGRGSWVNGRPPGAGTVSRVRLVMVWRKEADGRWRIVQEVFVPDRDPH